MKILVTGGAGFIGSHLVDALLAAGHTVVVIDNLRTGRRENLNAAATLAEMDIGSAQLADVVAAHRPEAVFHLAAQAEVRFSVAHPAADAQINIVGSVNLLQAARRAGVRQFIFASSGGAIYGDTAARPTPEDQLPQPASPYGIAKLAVEHYLRVLGELAPMRTAALRCANVYGPRQDARGEAGVVAIFCDRLLRGEPAPINGDGEQTRDFVFVSDVVSANLAAWRAEASGEFNIGAGREISVNQLAGMIRSAVGSGTFTHGPAKPGEQRRSCLDARRAKAMLGWQPQVALAEGIARTVAWFRQRQ